MTRTNSPLLPVGLGVLFAISAFYGGWQVADGLFAIAALVIIARGYRPAAWSLALALAILPGLFFTENAYATTTTLVRCLSVPVVLGWALRRPEWTPARFASGIAAGLAIQTVLLLASFHIPRQQGLTVNASELGQVGLMLFLVMPARPRLATAGVLGTAIVCLAAAAARVPLLGILVFAALARQRRRIVLAGVACAATLLVASLQGIGGRFTSFGEIDQAISKRITIATPSIESLYAINEYGGEPCNPQGFTWHGYGAGSFGATTRCVRPHVAGLIAVYELGIFAVVPAALAAWAVFTGRIPWFLAVTLASVWLFVDEPLAIPFGHYTIAAVAVVWISRTDGPRMRFAGLATPKRCLGPPRRRKWLV